MASGGYDGSVLLWEVATRRCVGPPLSGHHNQPVKRVLFSPDGSLLATAGGDASLLLWDVKAHRALGPPLQLQGHKKGVASAAFSPDGKMLASGKKRRNHPGLSKREPAATTNCDCRAGRFRCIARRPRPLPLRCGLPEAERCQKTTP